VKGRAGDEIGSTRRATPRSPGLARFLEVYRDARILPLTPADSEIMSMMEACLGCGNCLGSCPVAAVVSGHSYPGPRSVAAGLSRSLPEFWASADLAGLCTTCMACEEVCPGDVPVHRAILMMRAKNFEQKALEGEEPLTWIKRLVVDFLSGDHPAQAARWGAVLQGVAFKKTAQGEMKARLPIPLGPLGNRLVPPLARRSLVDEFGATPLPGEVSGGPKVAVFVGCLYNYAYTATGRSLIGVLQRHCREVVVPPDQVCCGAPALQCGDLPTARRLAVENAGVFETTGADFVVTACASCGSALGREYPRLGKAPGAGAAEAPPVGMIAGTPDLGFLPGRVRDIHAFLTSEVTFRAPEKGRVEGGPKRVITIHDPCHLARGQGLVREVRQLAQAIPGIEVREMDDSGVCCGGAGSYSLDHYALACAIRDRKLAGIARTGASLVVTGCPSCRMHIADGLGRTSAAAEVGHLVDLIYEAYRDGSQE
jgi:glycolate oxidase iron-sulfur subunit